MTCPYSNGALLWRSVTFVGLAFVLVVVAAIADHAFGWGTGVAAFLTAHSLWRQRRMEARVEHRLAESQQLLAPEPWPLSWPPDWRPSATPVHQLNPRGRNLK